MLLVCVFMLFVPLNVQTTVSNISVDSNILYDTNKTIFYYMDGNELCFDGKKSKQVPKLNATKPKVIFPVNGTLRVCEADNSSICTNVNQTISVSHFGWKFKSDNVSNVGIITPNHIYMSVKSSHTNTYISRFRLNDSKVMSTYPTMNETDKAIYLPSYDPKGVFFYKNKTYFIANQKADEGIVAKITQLNDDDHECYIDMVLPCGSTPPHQQNLIDVAVIRVVNNSKDDPLSIAALFQTVNGVQNICFYPTDALVENFVIMKRAEICAGKTNYTSVNEKPSFFGNACNLRRFACTTYEEVDKCLNTCKVISGRANTSDIDLLMLNNTIINITINATSIAAIRLEDDSLDIIYLGGRDGNLYKDYHVINSEQFERYQHKTNLPKTAKEQEIKFIHFDAESNEVLVETNDQIITIKEDNCTGLSWRSCLFEDDTSQSLCGWCIQEPQRCTVLSECKATHWKPGIKGISQYNLPRDSKIDLYRALTDTEAGVLSFAKGPKSGGTKLVINGTFVGNDSAEVLIGNTSRCNISEFTKSIIKCTTEAGNGINLPLILQYGGELQITLNLTFSYLPDPTIHGIFPNRTFKSGGANMSVIGTGFQAIQSPEIGINGESSSFVPCHQDRRNNTFISCPAPTSKYTDDSDSSQETVELKLDGVTLQNPVEYTKDPVLKPFDFETGSTAVQEFYPSTRFIIIKGERLFEAARIYDYRVYIGRETCEIVISASSNDHIKCYPPPQEPKKANESSPYPEVVAQVGNYKQHVGYLYYKDDNTVVIISVLLSVIIIVVICLIILLRYKKIHNSKKLKEEIEKTEIAMTEQCREAFAEMQTDMTDVTENLVEHGIPFNQFLTYIFPLLFPQHPVKDIEKHHVLSDLQEHEGSEEELTDTMIKLDQLVNNKFFIVSVIKTLDYQPRFKEQERNDFASFLSLLLMKRMDFYTDIIEILITKLIRDEKDKKSKDLFKRCETISEKLIINWLYICMFNPIKRSSGPALFMLYKAIENLSLKWPTDSVTLKTRATLCQDNLLTTHIDSQEICIHVEMNHGRCQTDCRILDCDSISQVKSKCINAIYRREMGSEKPSLDSVDLEWQVGESGKMLYDEDLSSLTENGYRKLNTPKHYGITDGATLCLLSKEIQRGESDYANLDILSEDKKPILESEDTESTERVPTEELEKLPVFHLIPPSESCKKHLLDLNFNRLLQTKVNLKEYIDNIFNNIFNIHDIPIPVRHVFHLLETCGLRDGFDKSIIESWKINSYFMKYWSKILSQPEVLYDLNECAKPHIQTNMNVIVLAFINSFSPPRTLGKKSATQTLLFYKDCNEYRNSKADFFKSGATVAGVKSADLTSELGKLPYLIDTIPFNRRSMLYKIFLVIENYDDQITKYLVETEETRRLKLSDKLDEVFETMRNT